MDRPAEETGQQFIRDERKSTMALGAEPFVSSNQSDPILSKLRAERERILAATGIEAPSLAELETQDRGGCGWLASATLMFWDMAATYRAAGDTEHAGYAWQIADQYYLEYIKCAG